jgi:hypothetical protein
MLTSATICFRELYSKLRANYLTKTAGKTLALIVHGSQAISFGAQLRTHPKNPSWAKLHTIATTFAPFFVYMYLYWDCGLVYLIERLSPQLHG